MKKELTRVLMFIGAQNVEYYKLLSNIFMHGKWHFYASLHIGSVIAYLRIPCSDEAWQFQKKQYSKELKS